MSDNMHKMTAADFFLHYQRGSLPIAINKKVFSASLNKNILSFPSVSLSHVQECMHGNINVPNKA